ncbi:MAG: anaerobic ribonucleoside-triphosphate reductase [Candidatus Lokiarchaeota archaeon]
MYSDKNVSLLEKQLKVMGKKIRIDILKRLQFSEKELSFSNLQKSIVKDNLTSINFSFHLNTLKETGLIESNDTGYFLTSLGKKMLKALTSIEQIINEENKSLMIRTSKYSKEPFDIRKIEQFLQKEGEMNQFMAKRIAKIVKNRLFSTNIEYLTTPLMREYINAILLEEGLESIRHKLTRLGTPPYDTRLLYDNHDINPDNFLFQLGSEVSEQFLLLNLLPKDLADMYLSGQIILLNLYDWALKPLGLYIPGEILFERFKIKEYSLSNNDDFYFYHKMLTDTGNFLGWCSKLIATDFCIGSFDKYFISALSQWKEKKKNLFLDLLNTLFFSNSKVSKGSKISLEFTFEQLTNSNKDFNQISQFNEILQYLMKYELMDGTYNPLFLADYAKLDIEDLQRIFSIENFQKGILKNLIFQDSSSQFLNSTLVNQKFRNQSMSHPRLILDKIFINLFAITEKAEGNDDILFELLQERVESSIKFFNIKKDFIEKRIRGSRQWQKINTQLSNRPLIDQAIASISVLGMHKAIQSHCGIEFERLKTSENFLLNILDFIQKLLREYNEKNDLYYILTQPHSFHNSNGSNFKTKNIQNYNLESFNTKIINSNADLTLENSIILYRRFQEKFTGGGIFNLLLEDPNKLSESIELLYKTRLNGFSINSFLTR